MSRRATGCVPYSLIALAAICLLGLGCDTVLEADPTVDAGASADAGPAADAGPSADGGSITDILTASYRLCYPFCPLTDKVLDAVDIASAPSCATTTWSTQNIPLSEVYSLTGIWGSGSTNVFAVGFVWSCGGEEGKILHSDGSAWTLIHSAPDVRFYAVWGSSSQDVFVSGMPKLVCCRNCFAPGHILHFDGKSWSDTYTPAKITGLWGSGPNDVFGVGSRCANPDAPATVKKVWDEVVMHYDGTTWSDMLIVDNSLNSVWGSGPDDVFAVGDSGTILHYDGTAWTQMDTATKAGLHAVWGSGPDDVFAVGDGGTILHYDGKSWTPMTTGMGLTVWGVWGSSPTDVWAVAGANLLRAILHYDGKGWSAMCRDGGGAVAIWGSSPDDVYILDGEEILHSEP